MGMSERTKDAVKYIIDHLELADGGNKDYWENSRIVCSILKEILDGERSDTLCSIRWTEDDVRKAFHDKYGREPTEAELSDSLNSVNVKMLENVSIERGWDVLAEAV